MPIVKKIVRYFFRFLVVVLLLLVLLTVVLQLPAVQNFVAGKAVTYLEETLQTDVSLASIHLRLPESLVIEGFYLETPQEDTLVGIGELVVNFNLHQLFRKRIQLDKISLKDAQANIEIDATNLANFDFITEAFAADSTIASNPENIDTSAASTPWTFSFDEANFSVENVQANYLDDYTGILFRGVVGSLEAGINRMDLAKGAYHLGDVRFSNSDIAIEMKPSFASVDTTSTSLNYQISDEHLSMEKVNFALVSDEMNIETYLQKVAVSDIEADLIGDSVRVVSTKFLIEDSAFKYDVPKTPILPNQFDANHLDFTELNLNVEDVQYAGMEVEALLNELSFKEKNGFTLEKLQADFAFTPEKLDLQDFIFKTDQSIIKSEKTQVEYPFLAQNPPLQKLMAEVNIDLEKLAISDLHYWMPDLNEIAYFRKNKNRFLKGKLIGQGDLDQFNLQTLQIDNWNTTAKVSGSIKNPLDTANAFFDLKIDRFRITDAGILDWLLPNALPSYVELPNVISFVGSFKGTLDDFRTRINGQTTRLGAPVASELEISARIRNAMDLERAFFDVRLDSLYTTREDFKAYLPPDAIPDFSKLPEQLLLLGKAKGTVKNLSSDFKLLSVRDGKASQFLASGSVSDLLSGNMGFNIKLESAELRRADILAFLPDSLLPAYFKLPLIDKITGIIQGNTDNFNAQLSFNANGSWKAKTSLKNESYQADLSVDNLDLQAFFTNNYLDTLVGFQPSPWTIDLEIAGIGFDPDNDLNADLELSIRKATEPAGKGLQVNAQLQQETLRAKATALEEEIELTSAIEIDFRPNTPTIFADLNVEKLDLYALELAAKPFTLKGDLLANIEGYTPDTLNGKVIVRDVQVLYDSTFQQIDSLQIAANLDNGDNLVEITSDFLDLYLEGYFQFDKIQKVVQNWTNNYLSTEPQDTTFINQKANFDLVLDLHKPEIFSSGLIDNLNGLSPFVMTMTFDNQGDQLALNSRLDYLNYQGALLDSLRINVDANREKADYQAQLQNLNYQGIADIINLRTYGTFEGKILTNNLEIKDEKDQKRFAVRTDLEVLPLNDLSLKFDPKQILNYKEWQVSEENLMTFKANEIAVQNWKFYRNQQFVEIKNKGTEVVQVNFKDFNLAVIGNMIEHDGGLLGGMINGNITVNDPLVQPLVEADVNVDTLIALQANLGALNLNANTNPNGEIATDLSLVGNENDLKVKGVYDLNNPLEALDFELDMTSLSLKSIEPLTLGSLENATGFLKGNLALSGSLEQPSLIGKTHFEEAAFNVALLKTKLKIGDQPIIFDANAIEFNELKLYDANGNEGTVSSYLLTDDYRDFYLQTDIEVDDFQVLNTTAKDNDMYYGKLVVDAAVSLRGQVSAPIIEVTASPEEGSDLTYIYSANSNSIISSEGIVEFVKPPESLRIREESSPLLAGASDLNMKIIVRMSISEELKFKAITNAITGDFFEGKAKGDIVFIQNPDETMEMTGKVEVVEGEYLFTYQNVVRRKFRVEEGSALRWTGTPENPALDITILYELKTSPYPLLATGNGSDADNSNLTARRTFVVALNVDGTATNTNIKTEIRYPGLDNTVVANAVNRINQDPNQANTQAFGLILFNGFIADDVSNNDFQVLGAQQSVNDVITAQLNNLANKYIKFVDVEFGVDEGEGTGANTAFSVSVKKQFLDDRLTISVDGTTTSNANSDNQNQVFLDNITVQYALTPDGKYRIKVYNQQEFDDNAGQAGIKVGGAFVFSKDYNEIRLFNKEK